MPSIIPGYEYDIFISYRQNDNQEGWVTEFINSLQREIKSIFKENISIYFDENPYDGLGDTHQVDESLAKKLKCLIFIPIISKTYCDSNSFAWTNEFLAFNKIAETDEYGLKVILPNGNTTTRVLPIRIHNIDDADRQLVENEIGFLRSIDFVYKSAGVNRPLRPNDDEVVKDTSQTFYRDQINKVANAIQEVIAGLKAAEATEEADSDVTEIQKPKKTRFRKELNQRNVIRASLVYVLAALVFWKVSDISIGLINLPERTLQFVTLLLIVFFPIAMIMAWLYERSPKGFIRTGTIASRDNPFTDAKKKPLTSNTFILLLVITVAALFLIYPNTSGSTNNSNATITSDNKSIAVLYFDNMSGDPEQEYFCDGITEEIIARISKIEDLRVISRTSVRAYKGQPLSVKKIAEELNVSAILEGSVRKSGSRVRITAQLIDTQTDEHIWTEIFERELTDIFQVQKEIAMEIANKFELEITPETDLKISKIPTSNVEAYEYYLKARNIADYQYVYIWGEEDFRRSRTLYEKAIELDPGFALAYAGLADLYDAYRLSDVANFPQEYDSLRHALSEKAYRLDPKSSFVNSIRSWMFLNAAPEKVSLDSGFYYLNRALELDPKDALNSSNLGGFFIWYVGLYDQSFQYIERALELDPLDQNIYLNLSAVHERLGNIEAWGNAAKIYQDLSGETNTGRYIRFLILDKKFEEAETSILEMENEAQPYYLALLHGAKGEKEEALSLIKDHNLKGLNLDLLLGNKMEVYEWAENQLEIGRNDYLLFVRNPLFDPYRNDPRFQQIVERARLLHDEYSRKYTSVILPAR